MSGSSKRLGGGGKGWFRQETVLVALLIAEWAWFNSTGPRFATLDNSFDILRHSVEVGLLALAITPVMIAGGIDLSVGSLLGLCAILFGKLWRDAGLSPVEAAICTLGFGAAAGGLNAALIAGLRLPALIVTLGTYSLFRGLAEAITRGVDTFTNFPASFLFLGQERWLGIPAQAPVFLLVALAIGILVHRTTFGRSLRVIGFSPGNARAAGLPVGRRLALTYLLAGTISAVAAVIYTARLGQAKADAGTGYEFFAITAVVLGGTSIYGGVGTVYGTLLGTAAIAILDNGMVYAMLPREAAGMLTGALLLLSLAGEAIARFRTARRRHPTLTLKSPVKPILALLLTAGLLLAGCGRSGRSSSASPPGGKRLTIAFMPKSKGNAYFISCRRGADRAAKDLGVRLIFDGPTNTDPAKQNEIIENWIDLGVDVIAAACENKEGISTALRKARSRGIKVITFDSDAEPDARSFFVNQATPQGIGDTMMDECARLCHGRGQFALIVASLTAANQREWEKYIEIRRRTRWPNMKMVAMRPCDDQKDKAQAEATALMSANPDLDAFICICTPSVPGAAEAVKQAGKVGRVQIVGLGLPSENKRYVKDGVLQNVILWKTEDLGYLTVCTAAALAKGTLHPGDKSITAGKLGRYQIEGDNVLLGKLAFFDKTNIDQAGF